MCLLVDAHASRKRGKHTVSLESENITPACGPVPWMFAFVASRKTVVIARLMGP